MKLLKKIFLALLVIIVVSSITGYYYFDKKFTPPKNYLNVIGVSENIPIKWISEDSNPNAALLLPIKLEGISEEFYMQLDFGSPITVFYLKPLNSVISKFSDMVEPLKNDKLISLQFSLGEIDISSNKFKVLDYGKSIDWEQKSIVIIGTIGTDLLEKRSITLNFKKNYCSFTNSETLNNIGSSKFVPFDFEKRRILFPAKMGDKELRLLYDSGTSGYEMITSREEWEKYRLKDSNTKIEKVNSWGNTLTITSAPTKEKIEIGNVSLNLSEVTYIEGTSRIQNLLMKLSGMQGMIGNKLFLDQTLIIDCKTERFRIY